MLIQPQELVNVQINELKPLKPAWIIHQKTPRDPRQKEKQSLYMEKSAEQNLQKANRQTNILLTHHARLSSDVKRAWTCVVKCSRERCHMKSCCLGAQCEVIP